VALVGMLAEGMRDKGAEAVMTKQPRLRFRVNCPVGRQGAKAHARLDPVKIQTQGLNDCSAVTAPIAYTLDP